MEPRRAPRRGGGGSAPARAARTDAAAVQRERVPTQPAARRARGVGRRTPYTAAASLGLFPSPARRGFFPRPAGAVRAERFAPPARASVPQRAPMMGAWCARATV